MMQCYTKELTQES